jgi:hypothetical protein
MQTILTYPETISFDPGDRIEGRFLRLERGRTREGAERAIAILQVGDSERSLWLHEVALRERMRELRPEAGELLVIVKGREKKESAAGRWYWPISVSMPERPSGDDGPIGWDDPLLGGVEQPSADRPTSPAQANNDDDIPF